MGRCIPSPSRTNYEVWRVSRALLAGSVAEPRPKTVLVYFNPHRLPLLTAVDSKFFTCILKSGGMVPQSKSWDTGTPRTPLNYAYA